MGPKLSQRAILATAALHLSACLIATIAIPVIALDQAPAAAKATLELSSIRVEHRSELKLDRLNRPDRTPGPGRGPESGGGSGVVGLTLRIAWIQQTPWTFEALSTTVAEAGRILAQCGIVFDRVLVESVLAAEPFRHLDNHAGRLFMQAIGPARPTVVLVHDTRNRPAFEAEAFGRGNTRTRPELADTVWLTAGVRDAGIALAHELVHVLADSGEHSALPGNLMQADTAPGHTALTGAQCARLIETGTLRGLLVRRGESLLPN